MGAVTSNGCELYYEEMGNRVPILLIHPAGATASTWGSATEELAHVGRVIAYGPPELRPVRRRTGALDLHSHGRRHHHRLLRDGSTMRFGLAVFSRSSQPESEASPMWHDHHARRIEPGP